LLNWAPYPKLRTVAGVRFVAGSQRRRRWGQLLVVAVLAGVVGGIATSLFAGASRSSSVVARYSAAVPRVDLQVFGAGLTRAEILALPGVSRVLPTSYVAMNRVDPNGFAGDGVNGNAFDYSGERDPSIRVLSGRFPDGSDPTHLAVNEGFARQFGLSTGDDLTVRMYRQDQSDELAQGIYAPVGPTYVFHIDAVIRQAMDIATEEVRYPVRTGGIPAHQSRSYILFPYDFLTSHRKEFLDFGDDYSVRLTDGPAGIDAFGAALAGAAPPDAQIDIEPGGNTRQASFDAPVDLETNALLGLGVALGVTAIVLVALLLRLEQRAHDADVDPLRALGMTRPELRAVAIIRVMPVALGAAALTAVVAIGLSARYPIGVGRQLELDGGIQLNLSVVLLGTVLIAVAIAAAAALLSRVTRDVPAVASPRLTLAGQLGRRGAPLPVTLGAHLAFESPNGRRSAAARYGVAVVAVLLIVVTAAGMWVAGVDKFHGDPASHGWPWDVVIGNSNFALPADDTTKLSTDPRFIAMTAASYGQLTVDGESLEALVVDSGGTAPLPVIAGRAPRGPGEVALGALTLRHHHLAIGSSVRLSLANSEFGDGGDVDVVVVGETLAPIFGESDLGDIAVVTFDAVASAGIDVAPQLVLARIDPHLDHDATIAALANELSEEVTIDIVPARAVNMHRVRGVPLVGIAIASVLAALVVGYTAVAGARSHRKELAILQALGLDRARVGWAFAWQGALTVVVALALGLPIGLIVGTNIWTRVAHGIGIDSNVSVPVWLALTYAGLVSAMSAAAGWSARTLRGELVEQLHAD
jgi:hypothetical protein